MLAAAVPLYATTKEKTMSDITIHRARERGAADHGWLQSCFSFSFAEYRNPGRMGFGALRVINDDVIAAGQGFPMHPHRDMEIVSIVTRGALEHRDSAGNHGVIRSGEIQYMSAASGVFHSEYASKEGEAALFQIWIYPDTHGGVPRYEQRDFNAFYHPGRWTLLVSGDGRDHSIRIRQDAAIYVADAEEGVSLGIPEVAPGHGRLLFVIEGSVAVGSEVLEARDEMQIVGQGSYAVTARTASKLLLFDVPMTL